MTREEMDQLTQKYFVADAYAFPQEFEHRVDQKSSAMMYSLIRLHKPKAALEIGTWRGGSTCIIQSALLKNGGEFTHIASELLNDLRQQTEENVLRVCGHTPMMIGDIMQNLDSIPAEIDFLFVDTDHDEIVTQWIEKHIFPRVRKGGIFVMHDWAVEEKDGKLIGKGTDGVGGWPETNYFMKKIESGDFPFQRIFWTWNNPGTEETAFWEKYG